MSIINVLIVVEAVSVLNDYKRNKAHLDGNYTQLGNQAGVNGFAGEGIGYIYMLTNWKNAWGEGDSELDVFAKPGDIIRWRMTSLAKDYPYQCYISGFVFNSGGGNITKPVPKHETFNIVSPDPTFVNQTMVVPKMVEDVYWESTVLNSSPVTYHTHFLIFQGGGGGGGGDGDCGSDGGGGCCGGYTYDPFINRPKNTL